MVPSDERGVRVSAAVGVSNDPATGKHKNKTKTAMRTSKQ